MAQSHFGLPASRRQFLDGLDRDLHLLVAEHHRTEHDFLVQAARLGLHHQHAFFGAGHHQIELRLVELRGGGIEDVPAVLIADARGADRTQERHAGNRQRRGGADQRGNVRIHFGIDREHRGDDLHVVGEAFGEQRADRPIDQSRGERFLLGGPALTFEEAAGNAPRGVGLFLIIDGQRKEVAARRRLLKAHRGHQHHRLAHGHEHRAVGLTREFARLDRYGVVPILKTFLGMAHVGPLCRK